MTNHTYLQEGSSASPQDVYENEYLESLYEARYPAPGLGTIPAGEKYLSTSTWPRDPLRGHGGSGDNLFLRWNVVPGTITKIDVVVHLHGYINHPPNQPGIVARPPISSTLRVLVSRSGLDLSGRARPTLAILPRGRRVTAAEVRSRGVRSDRFTFPALTQGNGGGLEALITSTLDWFARSVLNRTDARSLQIGRLIITAHSGGGAPLNELLRYHSMRRTSNPEEVHVFDAFYGSVDGVRSWVAARLRRDRTSRGSADSGGLRVFHLGGTQKGSSDVASLLPGPSDPLRACYRVEKSQVQHLIIPARYGGPLLRNCAADFGSRAGPRTSPQKTSRRHRGTSPQSSSIAPESGTLDPALSRKIQAAFSSGRLQQGLHLASQAGLSDENKLTNMIFFARHPERNGRKLERGEPAFTRLSREWLDIRANIVRPFLAGGVSSRPSSPSPAGPLPGNAPYPEVNTPLPASGPGFYRVVRRGQEKRSYGLPETIQALQEIAAAWHRADPSRPRIRINDISPPGGSLNKFEPHSSHRVGLDVDLSLEGGKSVWQFRDNNGQWTSNPGYSQSLTAELARTILNQPLSGIKVRFILFDEPQIRARFDKVVSDKTSPHRDHFHVRFCAPSYFAPRMTGAYRSRYLNCK